PHQIRSGEIGSQPQCYAETCWIIASPCEDAKTRRVSSDLIEKECCRGTPPIIEMGNGAQFKIPVRTIQLLELSGALHHCQPVTEISNRARLVRRPHLRVFISQSSRF